MSALVVLQTIPLKMASVSSVESKTALNALQSTTAQNAAVSQPSTTPNQPVCSVTRTAQSVPVIKFVLNAHLQLKNQTQSVNA